MIDFHSKEFNDAKPIRFVIPSYQRGYRWREDDVKKFDDLPEYNGESIAEFKEKIRKVN